MDRCCRPLKRKAGAFTYASLAGFVAGPLLFIRIFGMSGSNWAKVGVFFGGLGLFSMGIVAAKTLIRNDIRLRWDDLGLVWEGARREWAEFSSVEVLNDCTMSSVTGSLSEFERELLLKAERGEDLKLPFFDRSLLYKGEEAMNDPDWLSFLDALEHRFSLPSGSLAAEQRASPAAEKAASALGTPGKLALGFAGVAVLILAALLIVDASATRIKAVMAGYFLLGMLLSPLGKKEGREKARKFFRGMRD
jgi:hypothetical protein